MQGKPKTVIRAALALLVVVTAVAFWWFRRASESPPQSPLQEIRIALDQGRYTQAESLAAESVRRLESQLPADSLELAHGLDLFAEALWRTGKSNSDVARDAAARSVQIKERLLGDDAFEIATSLVLYGRSLSRANRRDEAHAAYDRALRIAEHSVGPDDPAVARILRSIAFLQLTEAQFDAAKRSFERALNILEHVGQADSLEAALVHNGLAGIDHRTGDYVAARFHWETALAIRESLLGPEHPLISGMLNNLGALLVDMGDYGPAEKLLKRALELRKATLPATHFTIAATTTTLGVLYQKLHDLKRARESYTDALAILEAHYPEAVEIPILLNNLAEVNLEFDKVDAARQFYARALDSTRRLLGNHPLAATVLQDLAELNIRTGQLDSARAQLDRARSIRVERVGAEHPDQAVLLALSAEVLAESGEFTEAIQLALEAERIGRRSLQLAARSFAEREALRYAEVRSRGLDVALSIAQQTPIDKRLRRRLLESIVRSRALVLDEVMLRRKVAREAATPEVAVLIAALENAGRRLSTLAVRGVGGGDPRDHIEMLERAQEEKDRLEREIAIRSDAFRVARAYVDVGLDHVEANLPDGSALISYVQYSRKHLREVGHPATKRQPDCDWMMAVVLLQGDSEPRFIPLAPAAQIDSLVESWYRELTAPRTQSSEPPGTGSAERRLGGQLRELVWDPVASACGARSSFLVVPEGSLYRINFAAFPVGEHGYLVDDPSWVHSMTAERDLVSTRESGATAGHGLIAVADVDFDATDLLAQTSQPKDDGSSAAIARSAPYRTGTPDLGGVTFEALPGTVRELREITDTWRAASESTGDVLTLTGSQATETRFTQEVIGRRAIHIATHGFFLSGDVRSNAPGTRRLALTSAAEPRSAVSFSKTLSGLAFAGANHRSQTTPASDDGILTVDEIALLDLRSVDWAALSACETGVGTIQTGEGVLGMRRAFRVAGVRSLVMSLWDVADDPTVEWMTRFYRARLLEKLGTAESVRLAARDVLAARRARGESTHPFYWAGFVGSGEWN